MHRGKIKTKKIKMYTSLEACMQLIFHTPMDKEVLLTAVSYMTDWSTFHKFQKWSSWCLIARAIKIYLSSHLSGEEQLPVFKNNKVFSQKYMPLGEAMEIVKNFQSCIQEAKKDVEENSNNGVCR